jgi:hypothetical protein
MQFPRLAPIARSFASHLVEVEKANGLVAFFPSSSFQELNTKLHMAYSSSKNVLLGGPRIIIARLIHG